VRCSVVACQGEHDAPGAGWQAGKEEVTTVALGRWRSAAPQMSTRSQSHIRLLSWIPRPPVKDKMPAACPTLASAFWCLDWINQCRWEGKGNWIPPQSSQISSRMKQITNSRFVSYLLLFSIKPVHLFLYFFLSCDAHSVLECCNTFLFFYLVHTNVKNWNCGSPVMALMDVSFS